MLASVVFWVSAGSSSRKVGKPHLPHASSQNTTAHGLIDGRCNEVTKSSSLGIGHTHSYEDNQSIPQFVEACSFGARFPLSSVTHWLHASACQFTILDFVLFETLSVHSERLDRSLGCVVGLHRSGCLVARRTASFALPSYAQSANHCCRHPMSMHHKLSQPCCAFILHKLSPFTPPWYCLTACPLPTTSLSSTSLPVLPQCHDGTCSP
jgi:hypothetical protein